ncbi:hypothetical protein VP01_6198g1, partial [Puccinia sorghi]
LPGCTFKSKTATAPHSSATAKPSTEETLWRLRAYLDSKGLCHHFKKPVETLLARVQSVAISHSSTSRLVLPNCNFNGRPTLQPPAGCFSVKSVLVAALTEDTFPELDEASIATLASLDEELANLNATRYVDRSKPQRLLIYLFHNGKCLCGLVYTGSEINLISEEAAAFANLPRQPLPRPKKISLALQA